MAKKNLKLKKKKDQTVKKNYIGSGGLHSHWMVGETTELDGGHDHLFVVNGLPLFTNHYDGQHTHQVNAVANRTGPEDQKHKHKVKYNGIDLMTSEGGVHIHEIGTNETTYSGLHRHTIVLDDGTEVQSILPGDLLQAQIRKRVHLEIQSVHVSSLLFPDQQEAIQFIEDRGFTGREVQKLEDGFKFRQLSRDRFKEESLKEIELSNGVKAIVGLLDPDKMDDAHKTLEMLRDIDPAEEIMKDEQIAALARLKDLYSDMIVDMKNKAEHFVPVLNQFIDLSDEFVKNEPFQEFLTEFIDSFSVLQGELGRIDNLDDMSKGEVEKRKLNFEDHLRDIEPILKSLSDIFFESEGWANFGNLLQYNQALFKQMILNLPLVRSEGKGTPIEKTFNNFIDLEKTNEDEFEHLTLDDISTLKIKEIETSKLNDSESVNSALNGLLKKLKPEGDICVDLGCGTEKPEGWIGINKDRFENVNLCYNLDNGIPLPTDSVDLLCSNDFIQTIENREMLIEQISRVLKNGGEASITAPATDGRSAFLPCNKSLWNEEVFKYCAKKYDLEILACSTDLSEDKGSATVKVKFKRSNRSTD